MALAGAAVCGVLEARRRQALRMEAVAVLEEKEERAGAADAVRRVLMDAYTRLRKGGVSVRAPWISACIVAIDAGKACPPDLAVLAIEKTRRDLPEGRYNTGYLDDAIEQLKGLGA